jgi:hypothetical protein
MFFRGYFGAKQGTPGGAVNQTLTPALEIFSCLTSTSKLAATAAEKQRSCGLRIVLYYLNNVCELLCKCSNKRQVNAQNYHCVAN